jgi:hypothetical protein
MAISAAFTSGCAEPGSWLVVHNRTTAPIVVVELYNESEGLVEACSSAEFRLTGRGPNPNPPTDPSAIPSDAVRIPVSAVGPADASTRTTVVVSTEAVSEYETDDQVPSSLPPCQGLPPAADPVLP